jgi:hypothetical protein
VVDAYKQDATTEHVQGLRADITHFLRDHQGTLDQAFEAAYGLDFGPELWSLTAETVLKNLDRQLKGPGKAAPP